MGLVSEMRTLGYVANPKDKKTSTDNIFVAKVFVRSIEKV